MIHGFVKKLPNPHLIIAATEKTKNLSFIFFEKRKFKTNSAINSLS